MVLNPPGRK